MKIGYTTDLCKPYSVELSKIDSCEELESFVERWNYLAHDAYESVFSPTFNWDEFRSGRVKEKAGKYAGDTWAEKYGAIMMPAVLLQVGIVAQQYQVPDGCVFIRMRDQGMLHVENGYATVCTAPKEGQ